MSISAIIWLHLREMLHHWMGPEQPVMPQHAACSHSSWRRLVQHAPMRTQVYQAAPHILLPVMPNLLDELRDREDAKRLEAVEVLGRLFSMRDCSASTEFPELFEEFLRRLRDQKASAVLRRCPLLAEHCASGTQGSSCIRGLPVETLLNMS